jgi:hypothetical protein
MITGRLARQGHGSAACRPGAPAKNENSVDCSALVDQGSLSTAQRFGRVRRRSGYLKFYRFAELFSNMRPSTMRAPTSIRTARDDSARSGTVGQAISLARRLASKSTFATLHFHLRFALRISRQHHHRIKDQAAQPLLYGKKARHFVGRIQLVVLSGRASQWPSRQLSGAKRTPQIAAAGALDFRVYHSTRSLSCL